MMNDELPPDPAITRPYHSSFITHPSSFTFLLDPPASGAWNMAVDEALLTAAANDGQCALRFYRWQEPTLSLGYFQAYADRRRHEASVDCPVVRRASGGGAILHDIELTYSLAVPEGHPLAVGRLRTYRVVHEALIEALAQWGIEAAMFVPPPARTLHAPREEGEERFVTRSVTSTLGATWSVTDTLGVAQGAASAEHQPFLCFQRRAPGDVLIGGAKIAGSAQRRCRGAVLQHGSLLLARSEAAPELDGLKELSGRAVAVEELMQAWWERLAAALAITGRRGDLSEENRRQAAQLAAEKYASTAWTNVR